MITRAQIKEKDGSNKYRVLIPVFAGLLDMANTSNIAINKEGLLTSAYICSTPFYPSNYELGDIVYVTFEENDLSKPVIIGKLYLADNTKNKFDLENQFARLSSVLSSDSKYLTTDNLDDLSIQEPMWEKDFTFRVNRLINYIKNTDDPIKPRPVKDGTTLDSFSGWCATLAKSCVTNNPTNVPPLFGCCTQGWSGDGKNVVNNFNGNTSSGWSYRKYIDTDKKTNRYLFRSLTQFYQDIEKFYNQSEIINCLILSFSKKQDYTLAGHALYIDSIQYDINNPSNSPILWIDSFNNPAVHKTVDLQANNSKRSIYVYTSTLQTFFKSYSKNYNLVGELMFKQN